MDIIGHLTIFQKMDNIPKLDLLLLVLDNFDYRQILSFTNKIVKK